MFIDFIISLVLGGFALYLFLVIAFLVIHFLAVPLIVAVARAREPLVHAWSRLYATLVHFLMSVIFTGFIAIISRNYASHSTMEHPWVYAIFGFVVAWLANAGTAKYFAARVNHRSPPETEGAAVGAGLAVFAGFVAYPVFYTWPHVIASIPGINILFTWSRELANWLGSFSLLRIIAVLFALVFLLDKIPIINTIVAACLVMDWIKLKRLLGIEDSVE